MRALDRVRLYGRSYSSGHADLRSGAGRPGTPVSAEGLARFLSTDSLPFPAAVWDPTSVLAESVTVAKAESEEGFEGDGFETPLFPLESRPGNVSNTWTLMNFLRGTISVGCLALPLAFKQCGLWAGLAFIFTIGFLNIHTMLIMLRSADYLRLKSGKREVDYGHLAKTCFDYSNPFLQRHSRTALYVTNFFICLIQLGLCSVQYVFIATHLRQVMGYYSDTAGAWGVQVYMFLVLAPLLLLNFIRELWVLAIFSTVANFSWVIAFVIMLYLCIASNNKIYNLPAINLDLPSLISGMGSMVLAFEDQAMILPMANRMKTPEVMSGWNGVLCTGMEIATCLFAALGFFGYSTFGSAVTGSIAESFPHTTLFVMMKVMLIVAVFVGYGIQMYIVIELLWAAILRKIPTMPSGVQLCLDFGLRILLVSITFSVASIVRNLEDLIPLVGNIAGMTLAFVIPPIIYEVTFFEAWQKKFSQRKIMMIVTKDCLIVVWGLFFMVGGVVVTIQKLTK